MVYGLLKFLVRSKVFEYIIVLLKERNGLLGVYLEMNCFK